jgi:hypothetical protein
MKEKRRITSDGYFEVSTDGGKTYTKTTMKPTNKELLEWKTRKYTFAPDYFSMPTRQASMPEIKSPAAIDNTLEPKQSTSLKKVEEIGAEAMRKKREADALANSKRYGTGLETLLGAAQAGYGLQQLLKDKRPVGEIDPAYSALTDEAIAASKYGYTPTQKALLEQDILNARIAQQARINQLAGGNAAVGLTNARVALNDWVRNKMKLEAQDEQTRMEKRQAALQPAGVRAQFGRQLFQDKMNEFMQKQQAGAELLGAGIQNVVGARRYQREREAQDQINKMMYGNTNLG